MNEKELVLKSKKGDREAFALLYSLYRDRLYRYALYRLENTHDAEDAVSEAVCSAFYGIKKLKNPESFSSWIFKILYRSCGDIIKSNERKRKSSDIDELSEKLSYGFEDEQTKTELMQALDILSGEEREIVLLTVVLGLKSKEAADVVNMTPGSVRSRLSRSLAKMRSFLEEKQ